MIYFAGTQVTTNDDPYGGISLVLFCSGCKKRCKGCHNPELQKFSGKQVGVNDIVIEVFGKVTSELIDSIVFQGGDWIYYPMQFTSLLGIFAPYKRKILYTGELFENIRKEEYIPLLDVIIDGEYKEELPSGLVLPVTSNQRVWIKRQGLWYTIDPKELPINKGE